MVLDYLKPGPCRSDWVGVRYVAKDALELLILLPPEYWGNRCAHQAQPGLLIPLTLQFWSEFRRNRGDKSAGGIFCIWVWLGILSYHLTGAYHIVGIWNYPVLGETLRMCVLPLPVSPSPLLTSPLFCVARWRMSITDVLSADDIAAALQECQGEGGLEEQGVVALWGPEAG